MPTTAQYLNELIAQKKALANGITAKGVAASESEKFNTLVPKVAQIEELKGEEKVLDNITQYNNTPQSIVSINYPENVSKKIDLQLSSKNLFDKSIPIKDVYVTADAIRKGYKIPVNAGTYTVSGGSNDTFCKTLIGDIYGAYHLLGISQTLTLETDGYILIYGLDVQFVTAVLDTLQMESGSTATAYTPYISDFSNVNVKACGKNLLENPNVHALKNTTAPMRYFYLQGLIQLVQAKICLHCSFGIRKRRHIIRLTRSFPHIPPTLIIRYMTEEDLVVHPMQ